MIAVRADYGVVDNKDLRAKTDRPAHDVITRTVRYQISQTHTLDNEQDEAIAITVQETLNAIPAGHSDPE